MSQENPEGEVNEEKFLLQEEYEGGDEAEEGDDPAENEEQEGDEEEPLSNDNMDEEEDFLAEDFAEAIEQEDEMNEMEKPVQQPRPSRRKSSVDNEAELKRAGLAAWQADAIVQVRPRGYKDVEELLVPMQTVTLDVSAQVTEKAIDQEWAKAREIILASDDILWPTVQEFTLEKGGQRIHDYITMCWKLDKKWMYNVHPVQTFSDHLRKRFIYEVKFSVPTPLSPMPQATASVFFNYEISHFASKDEVVKVHYVVEGTRFVHYPAALPFQDKWLWSVISDKIRLQRSVDF